MTKKIMVVLILVAIFSACSNKDNTNTSLNETDQQFLMQASYSNYNEISAGDAAAVHGFADSVRIFAQMMVRDHTAMQAALDSLGRQFNLHLPQSADSAHVNFRLKLQTLSQHVFDTTYMGAEVRDHQLALTLFQDEISNGNSPPVKNYASKYLPVIQEHLQMAQVILSRLH